MSKGEDRKPRVFMMDLLAIVPYYTAYLSKALLAEGIDLTVGSISYYLDPKCFSSRGIRLDPGALNVVGRYHLPKMLRRGLKLPEALINLAALTLRFLVSPPEIIHVQYLAMLRSRLPFDLWFLEICRWRGSKIVLTVHDLLPHDTGERYRKIFHELYGTVDRIICHSDSIRARLEAEFGIAAEKIWVIPHGPFFYDLPVSGSDEMVRSFGIEPGERMVLWQGIIFPYKGIDLLLNAWREVEASGMDACLLIAGTGAPEFLEEIREQIARLGLKRVRLVPRFISTEELVAIYRAAEVVVYPYRAITTSGALATGLALGKAIVASDLPVFRELLTNGENALLVDPENGSALAGAVMELLRNPQLRGDFVEKVNEMHFGDRSWDAIAMKTVACYRSFYSG